MAVRIAAKGYYTWKKFPLAGLWLGNNVERFCIFCGSMAVMSGQWKLAAIFW